MKSNVPQATYQIGDRILASGIVARHRIITYSNGTVDAKCEKRQRMPRVDVWEKYNDPWITQCMGDHVVYDGVVSYGSLKVERYSDPMESSMYIGFKRGYLDVDVDNGCIPLVQGPFSFKNFNHSVPAEPLFAIPRECFKEPDTASSDAASYDTLLGLESSFRSNFPSFFPSFEKANSFSAPALRGRVGENHTSRNVEPHLKK